MQLELSSLPVYSFGTCETCRSITLDALRDAYKDRLVAFSARYLSLSYPSILLSARSCPLCAMLVDQIRLRLSPASVRDFLARPVTVCLWTEYQPGGCEPGQENLRNADINIFAIFPVQEQGSEDGIRSRNICVRGFLGAHPRSPLSGCQLG
jgi:hypothetical protein